MITLNKELGRAIKDRILDIYDKMVVHEDFDQMGYVNNKLLQKIAVLQHSSVEMERYISAYARIIHELLKDETNGGPTKNHHKYMLSALYYFCDPYDYIPDLVQDEGYVDDALVFNQCLAVLKKESRETFQRIENYIRDSNI